MSRTDSHLPFRLTEYGMMHRAYRNGDITYGAFQGAQWLTEYNTMFARPATVGTLSRAANRAARRNARAAIRRGDFDALQTRASGRHSAVYDAI